MTNQKIDPLKGAFTSYETAEVALHREGFIRVGTVSAAGPFNSRDGLITALIRYRPDGRYQVDMHA